MIKVKLFDYYPEELLSDELREFEKKWFFFCPEYYRLQESEIIVLIAFNDTTPVGGVIGRIRGDKFPMSILSKSMWVESGLMVFEQGKQFDNEIKKVLLNALSMESKKRKCIRTIFNHWSRENDKSIFEDSGYNVNSHQTLYSDLSLSEEELYRKFSKGHKSTIKKAIKNNCEYHKYLGDKDDDYFKRFYELYKSTQERAIVNNPNSTMTLKSEKFLKTAIKSKNIPMDFVYVTINNDLAAGGLFVYSHNSIVYYIGASDIQLNRQYGASNYMIWESMKMAKQAGVPIFDFGGIPFEPDKSDPAYGVYKFKKSFGGQLMTFYLGAKDNYSLRSKLFTWLLNNRKYVRKMIKYISD